MTKPSVRQVAAAKAVVKRYKAGVGREPSEEILRLAGESTGEDGHVGRESAPTTSEGHDGSDRPMARDSEDREVRGLDVVTDLGRRHEGLAEDVVRIAFAEDAAAAQRTALNEIIYGRHGDSGRTNWDYHRLGDRSRLDAVYGRLADPVASVFDGVLVVVNGRVVGAFDSEPDSSAQPLLIEEDSESSEQPESESSSHHVEG